ARFSLSPLSYLGLEPGTRIALASPNGATCACYGGAVPHLFVGTLINAEAVAAAVTQARNGSDLDVTLLACGERWEPTGEDGPLRPAVEDYLGAGAILSYLNAEKSPECRVCEG